MFRSTNHAKGQAFTLYIMLYSTARFFLEYLRGDYNNLVFGLFKSAQMTSLCAFTIALLVFIVLGMKKTTPVSTVKTGKKKR